MVCLSPLGNGPLINLWSVQSSPAPGATLDAGRTQACSIYIYDAMIGRSGPITNYQMSHITDYLFFAGKCYKSKSARMKLSVGSESAA